MKDEFIKAAKELEEQIIRDRRHIHKYPEVGMEVPKTYAYVKKKTFRTDRMTGLNVAKILLRPL